MTVCNRYTVGDDISISGTIVHNGVVQDIAGWTLACAIVKPDMKTLATGSSVVAGVLTGDGSDGKFSIEFPSTDTDSIVPGEYWLEVQATVAGKVKTMDRVKIQIQASAIVPEPIP